MGKQRSPQQGSTRPTDFGADGGSSKRVTPPKGRPTRARNARGSNKRAFGPIAQWVTVAVAIVLVVVVLVLVTGGGDFNPFNDEERPSQFGAPAAVFAPA